LINGRKETGIDTVSDFGNTEGMDKRVGFSFYCPRCSQKRKKDPNYTVDGRDIELKGSNHTVAWNKGLGKVVSTFKFEVSCSKCFSEDRIADPLICELNDESEYVKVYWYDAPDKDKVMRDRVKDKFK
tara:strand:- start:402 stop:785 length:384 start_codon:yes stop_codon:yes gene_type:complete